jgi:hypothetical protein
VRALSAEPARLQSWLDVESALAGPQAELGIHPRGRWPRYRPQGAREVPGSRRPRADGRRRTHMERRMTVTPQICAASTVGFARCGLVPMTWPRRCAPV